MGRISIRAPTVDEVKNAEFIMLALCTLRPGPSRAYEKITLAYTRPMLRIQPTRSESRMSIARAQYG